MPWAYLREICVRLFEAETQEAEKAGFVEVFSG